MQLPQVTTGNLRRLFQVSCSLVIKLHYVIALQRKPGGVMRGVARHALASFLGLYTSSIVILLVCKCYYK